MMGRENDDGEDGVREMVDVHGRGGCGEWGEKASLRGNEHTPCVCISLCVCACNHEWDGLFAR